MLNEEFNLLQEKRNMSSDVICNYEFETKFKSNNSSYHNNNRKLHKRLNKNTKIKTKYVSDLIKDTDRYQKIPNGSLSINSNGNDSIVFLLESSVDEPVGSASNSFLLSKINDETFNRLASSQVISENKSKDVCLIEESPFYIHKIAQTERLEEFKRLFYEDPTRLSLRDNNKSWLPIHYAVFKSKLRVLEFIIENGPNNMINEVDLTGNTPLHIAIERGHLDCCKYLLSKKADTNILNKSSHAPIHQCVLTNKPEILDMMLGFDQVDIHLGGENGSTALHYCAYYDNLECAKVLIKHKANLCKPCNNGFFPIHTAAQRCSNLVLEYLIDEGGKMGNSRLKMLSFVDGDNNKPLHAAVQFGNLGAVKLCLDNGALIDELIELDNSTPIHVACAQGSLEILRLMSEIQPDLFLEILHSVDSLQMTPLHKAAMFDHVDVAAFLLEKGAYIDSLDIEKRSPMLLAANRNCVNMVCFLLTQGANTRLKDKNLRNLLHLVITQEVCSSLNSIDNTTCSTGLSKLSTIDSLEKISEELFKKENFIEIINESDLDGCSPAHYASKLGYTKCLVLLMKHGASIGLKNIDKQTVLHFAAKYGRYNCCMEILNTSSCKNFINDKDHLGYTALHLAAQNGHYRVVQMLMHKGALIYKSFSGNNPFHEAALSGSTYCMKIIYGIDFHILNSVNKDGNTALHLAAQEGRANVIEFLLNCGAEFKANKQNQTFMDVAIHFKQQTVLLGVLSHNRWEEAMDLKSFEFKTPFIGIIQMSSEVSLAVMERCVTRNQTFQKSCEKTFSIKYNFKYLNWSEERVNKKGVKEFLPMVPLVTMVEYGRSDCLSHPLCEHLLQRKWNRYGLPLYALTTIFYLLFLFTLTLIVVTHPSCIHADNHGTNESTCSEVILENHLYYYDLFKRNYIYNVLGATCILFSLLNFIKEVLQLSIERIDYFKNFQVYIQLILYPSTLVFTAPFLFDLKPYHFQWEAGSIAIFSAWFNLLLYMQRFYFFGIYVVMFTEILKTLFKVIFLFSILLIGFGLVFYILLLNQENKANITPALSIFRTIIMLLGETDGLNTFIIPYTNNYDKTLHFGGISMLFLCIFVFLIPILLTNLLIGLAVGDIDSVRRNAKLKREAMQVQLHVDLERKMPRKLFEKVNEMEHEVFYGRKCSEGVFQKILGKFKKFENINESFENDTEHLLQIEILKQKQKLNSLRISMEKQTDMLRLVLNKLDIKSSNLDYDNEPSSRKQLDTFLSNNRIFNTNTSNNYRNNQLWKQSSSTPALRAIVLKQLVANSSQYDRD